MPLSATQQIASQLPGSDLVSPHFDGPPFTGSAFDVQEAADQSVAAVVAGAHSLARVRNRPVDGLPTSVERAQAMTAFSGHLALDGRRPSAWADLSGMYRASEGRHIQLHCNFPHHAAGVVDHLGTTNERAAVSAAIEGRDAFELEAELIELGLVAAACRTLDEWDQHPHAEVTQSLPLLEIRKIGEAPPRSIGASVLGPAGGCRVLDFSRVLAGPVCGQTLAAAGADVLRIGAPHLPSVPVAVMGTGFGKRNAFVDLGLPSGRAVVADLLDGAHVVVDAYRPGALAAKGLSPDRIVAAAPGSVIVQICAFDWIGPWANRRGFDSIVQSTTGIVLAGAESAGVEEPTPLPVQALDYATGFLAAGTAMATLAHQQREGGSWLIRLSLLRTRNWLLSLGRRTPFRPVPLPDPAPWLHEVDSSFGRLEAPAPLLGHWPLPPSPLGSSPAEWLS